jgi:adenosine deaminase
MIPAGRPWFLAVASALLIGGAGCRGPAAQGDDGVDPDAAADDDDDAGPADAAAPDAEGPDASPPLPCGSPSECAAEWEENASDRFDGLLADPDGLRAFLAAVPKGGDLHQHLTGAVWAETFLDWARADGDCINSTTYTAVYPSDCSTATQAVPTSGTFYDQIVGAWSMEGFVAGAQSGHDHFFATFGKFGAGAGAHRDEDIADVATRAASENEVYVETMFNLGKNVGSLAAGIWSGTLHDTDLPGFYDSIVNDPRFAAKVTQDAAVVTAAKNGYRAALQCDGPNPPAACDVVVRFIAQISRTGANDTIFGQLVSAYEMAIVNPQIVAANLSSPEDDSSSINNYNLHMAMLDFLYQKYTATAASPLHVTLHAGELTPAYLPSGSTANTFHIRAAVETGHAERIGHGLDVMSETDPAGLMDEMADRGVLVEVCLSSNDQILEISGADHPLAQYLAHGVPIALATDDQGVSRSSLAGEYLRGALDQHLDYRQLKRVARDSLEHAFLPGDSLWTSVGATPVAACAATDTMAIGDAPNATCQAFLDGSERARIQWELERRFLAFERVQ